MKISPPNRATTKYFIETQIIINAPITQVWQALTDFTNYDKWNPFIPKISGILKPNEILRIKIQVPGEKTKNYKVKLLQVTAPTTLHWLGHFMIYGLIDGRHSYELQHIDINKTLLIQYENFRGILVPFVWRNFLNSKLRIGFVLSNEGLKNYVEAKN